MKAERKNLIESLVEIGVLLNVLGALIYNIV